MATFPENSATDTGRLRLLPRGLICLALGLVILAGVPGCGGCRRETPQEKKQREKKEAEERARKKKEKPKPDFEGAGGKPPKLQTRPTGEFMPGPTQPLGAAYKPGHWTATTLEAKANNFQFVGDLEIVAADAKGTPIPIEGADYDLTTSCQITLGKRQRLKPVESILFVPPTHKLPVGYCRLRFREGGRQAWQSPNLLTRMPPYQYHLVVVAALPENYAYIEDLPSVKPPTDTFGGNPTKPYYRVSLIRAGKPGRRLPLPSYGLLWTSVACVLWDNAAPDALDLAQQEALLDWLHWGGQLILSGPGTLDKLSGSFLAPYLPATAEAGARALSQQDFEQLYQWSRSSGKNLRPLTPPKQFTGVKLQNHPQARFIPGSGELLVERRVGRGRIVVSAFGLGSRALSSWPGRDEMVNAFLLRRPHRRFVEGEAGEWEVRWADGRPRLDAGRICNLRYFGRDLCELAPDKENVSVGFGTYLASAADGNPNSGEQTAQFSTMAGWDNSSDWEGPQLRGPGVAAWNDFNPVASSARATLKNAAEIEIPSRSFVVWVVAAYLLVLVPVNWAVFRVINRVEWAWAAAPVIAVACTVVVIRMAQLDIGFARSRTEIAVVELQADYPRAHVTRYTALYTSLTTGYEFHCDDPGALVLPLPEVDHLEQYQPRDRHALLFRRGSDASLTGYSVQSNSTGLVHSEQMVDLGGGLSLVQTPAGGFQLVNGTQLSLRDVGVVRKDASGILWTVSLPQPLASGATVPLQFRRHWENPSGTPLWNPPKGGPLLEQPPRAQLPGGRNVQLMSLIEMAQDVGQLRPGQVRLVGWLDEQVPGLEVRPAAPQARFATLVVAHLKYDFGDDPQPDVNRPKPLVRAEPEADLGAGQTTGRNGTQSNSAPRTFALTPRP